MTGAHREQAMMRILRYAARQMDHRGRGERPQGSVSKTRAGVIGRECDGIFVKEGLPVQANKGGTADFGSVLLGQILFVFRLPFP